MSTTQSYEASPAIAASSATPPSTGSSIRIVGTSITSAPAARNAPERGPAPSVARVTTTRRPNIGRPENQSRSCAATSPTTIVDGERSARCGSSPSVERTTLWSGRVPHRTAAAGVVGANPPAISRREISPMWDTPMRITMVPPTAASASQFTSVCGLVGSSWPVTTVKLVEEYLIVTGMPPYAGAAIAEVIPGTTS